MHEWMIIVQPGSFRTWIESSQLACSVLGHHRREDAYSHDVDRLMISDHQLQVHAWILTLAFRGSLLGFRIRVDAGAAVVLLRHNCLSLSIR